MPLFSPTCVDVDYKNQNLKRNFRGAVKNQQEFEADTLGVRYLARGDYNTSAMTSFLKKLRAHSQLEARRHKKDPANVDHDQH